MSLKPTPALAGGQREADGGGCGEDAGEGIKIMKRYIRY